MINNSQSKEELLKELERLRLENKSLKTLYGQDISKLKEIEEALVKSEKKYCTLFNAIDEGYCIVEIIFDENGKPVDYRFLEINLSFERQTGLINAQGKRMRELAPTHEEYWFETYGKIAITGQPARFVNRAEQLHRWYDVYAFRIGNPENRQVAILFNDITERKRLELALKESEELFETLYENSLIGIYRTSPDGQILIANPTLVKMLGYSNFEELAARDLRREGFEPSYSRKLFLEQIEKNGEVTGLESEWIKKDGTVVYIRETARAIRDSSGKTLYYDGTVEDITERKRLDDVDHENERIYKELFEKAPVGYHELNSEGRIIRINHTELDMFGYTEEEMVGQYVWKFVSDEEKSRQRVLEKLKGILPPSIGAELVYRRKDLTTFPASVEDVILRDANNNVIGIRTTVQDITNRKNAEQEIQRLNEQLLKSNAEKDKFFSIIAHDLKSPFHGFLGLTQEIIKNANNISIKELIKLGNTMYQAADNLFKLLQNLLEWAQLHSGSISVEPKDILLRNMIVGNIEMIKNRADQKEISIINKVTEPIQAHADEKMINSVLLNLLLNAVKFTHQSGKITVRAKETEDQMIEISVKDTGVGIPKSLVKKIFNVGEKTGRKGTEGELSIGLGLLLCKEFIEKNNGRIWVESEEGAGSTFYFTLRSHE